MNMQDKLPKEVAGQYEVINWTGGHRQDFGAKFGMVDLTKLTIPRAAQLVRMGFPRLKAKAAQSKKATK